jgi:hypothetical protein
MSALSPAVEEYLSTRRALGFQLNSAALMLRDFASFVAEQNSAHITAELAVKWACTPAHAQPCQWSRRLGVIRCFARYHSASDPLTEIPAKALLPFPYVRTHASPMAPTARRQRRCPAVPQLPRNDHEPRRGGVSARQARHGGRPTLPVAERQARLSAYSASHGGHGVAPARSRSYRHCSLARARVGADHTDIPPRRSLTEGTCIGEDSPLLFTLPAFAPTTSFSLSSRAFDYAVRW